MSTPTLILTPRFTPDAQALWRAAGRLGWDVERLTSWRVPDELTRVAEPVFFLEGLMGPTLAAAFGRRLPEPPTDWLPTLPEEYRRRAVRLTTLGAARSLDEPRFVKPPNDKSFPARVHRGSELPLEFPDDMPVLVSEIVEWEKEFRGFILDRRLRTLSVYLRDGELQRDNDFAMPEDEARSAAAFVADVLADERVALPRAAVVEQNAAWGSGLYGCDPAEALQVLRFASEPM